MKDDSISRQAAIDGVKTLHDVAWKNWHEPTLSTNVVLDMIRELPSAQPERVWTPCDIPPEHHKDVIVRGIEAIGNVAVYKIMWRPENYVPSITWLDWSEI